MNTEKAERELRLIENALYGIARSEDGFDDEYRVTVLYRARYKLKGNWRRVYPLCSWPCFLTPNRIEPIATVGAWRAHIRERSYGVFDNPHSNEGVCGLALMYREQFRVIQNLPDLTDSPDKRAIKRYAKRTNDTVDNVSREMPPYRSYCAIGWTGQSDVLYKWALLFASTLKAPFPKPPSPLYKMLRARLENTWP